jgi:hypothetical protein
MGRLLLRVIVMIGAVLAGHALGGLVGAAIAACIGTVIVTQTEDVIRIARPSAELGGSGFQVFGRTLGSFFGHTLVRRTTMAIFTGTLADD